MTEEQRREVILGIRRNDESNTQMLDKLTQLNLNGDLIYDKELNALRILTRKGLHFSAEILKVGMLEYNTRIFNNLLEQNDED